MLWVMGFQSRGCGESLGKGIQADGKGAENRCHRVITIENTATWMERQGSFAGAHTLGVGRAEGHARSARVKRFLRTVKDANLPDFRVEDLYSREPFHHAHRPVATGAFPNRRLARRSRRRFWWRLSQ